MRIDFFRRFADRPKLQPNMTHEVQTALRKAGTPVEALKIRLATDGTFKISYGHGADHRSRTAPAGSLPADIAETIGSAVYNSAINRLAAERNRRSQFGW